MRRRRLAVAFLLPEPVATEVGALQRALGADPSRVAPHITLVPPVNVRGDAVAGVLASLRAAAASLAPAAVELGPATTFAPVNPVVYLAVGGPGLAMVDAARDAVFVGPLWRQPNFDFTPHATVADNHPPEQIEAALGVLAGYIATVELDRIALLEDGAPGPLRWNTVADFPLGRQPTVVVRGGVPLELAVSSLVDPEGLALFAPDVELDAPPSGSRPVVVTARRDSEVVAVLQGWRRDDEHGVVAVAGEAVADDDLARLLLDVLATAP